MFDVNTTTTSSFIVVCVKKERGGRIQGPRGKDQDHFRSRLSWPAPPTSCLRYQQRRALCVDLETVGAGPSAGSAQVSPCEGRRSRAMRPTC